MVPDVDALLLAERPRATPSLSILQSSRIRGAPLRLADT